MGHMADSNDQNRKFLIFSLQDSLYALDLATVAEVSDPVSVSPIPFAPGYYSGALSFHGDIVAVMNLAHFLGGAEQRAPGKMIVLRPEIASLAFLVDTVLKIVSEDEISARSPARYSYSTYTLVFSGLTVIQLDLAGLVTKAESEMHGSR